MTQNEVKIIFQIYELDKKILYLFLIIFLIVNSNLLGQSNLISNSGFEPTKLKAPIISQESYNFEKYIKGWSRSQTNHIVPAVSHEFYHKSNSLKALSDQIKNNGKCFIVIETLGLFSGDTLHRKRGYLMTKLLKPIDIGDSISVVFDILMSLGSNHLSNGIEVYFCSEKNDFKRVMRGQVEPQIKNPNIIDHQDWKTYTFTFIAKSKYKYICIGKGSNDLISNYIPFKPQDETTWLSNRNNKRSVFAIDNFMVMNWSQ